MNWHVLIKQVKSLSFREHEFDAQYCAQQHFCTYGKKTLPPRYQNWLLGELLQCLRYTCSSSEPDSNYQQNRSGHWVTVLRMPRESQPSPPRLGQHLSHTSPQGRELPSSWLSNRNQLHLPKAAGCLQSMGEHTTARLQTQDCASSNKVVPSPAANFHTDKVRKENKCRNCILEKRKHLLKDFLKAIPHLLKAALETQLHSSWQSLQVTPHYPAERDDSAIAVRQSVHVTMESSSQKRYFSGSACGNPDKIEKLSWQGMMFSHALPEGLEFLSHPTLLA